MTEILGVGLDYAAVVAVQIAAWFAAVKFGWWCGGDDW